eukprot:755069-Hanusia_phi.AAC.1
MSRGGVEQVGNFSGVGGEHGGGYRAGVLFGCTLGGFYLEKKGVVGGWGGYRRPKAPCCRVRRREAGRQGGKKGSQWRKEDSNRDSR